MREHVHVRATVAFVLSKAQLCEGAYDLKICEISFAIPGLKISLAPKTQVIEKRITDVMTYRIPADMNSKMLISITLRNQDTEKVIISYVFLFSGGGGGGGGYLI